MTSSKALSGGAGHQHAERGADSEAAEEAMTDEERPNARPRLKYQAGFKRIFAVLAVCWVALCLIAVAATLHGPQNQLDDAFVGVLLAAAVIVPALGYVFFFRVVPWIIEGFRKK
jgi:hypothetical protein